MWSSRYDLFISHDFVQRLHSRNYLKSEICAGLNPLIPAQCGGGVECARAECDCRFSFFCNGKCIPKSKVSFGFVSGTLGYSFYVNGKLLHLFFLIQVCDGRVDCDYGVDESNCMKACQAFPHFTYVHSQSMSRESNYRLNIAC